MGAGRGGARKGRRRARCRLAPLPPPACCACCPAQPTSLTTTHPPPACCPAAARFRLRTLQQATAKGVAAADRSPHAKAEYSPDEFPLLADKYERLNWRMVGGAAGGRGVRQGACCGPHRTPARGAGARGRGAEGAEGAAAALAPAAAPRRVCLLPAAAPLPQVSRPGGAVAKPDDFYRLYALHQQATQGDNTAERPMWAERGGLDFEGG